MTIHQNNSNAVKFFLSSLFSDGNSGNSGNPGNLENREYCDILKQSAQSCYNKNYEKHPPCEQLVELFNSLKCYSEAPRLLHPLKFHNLQRYKVDLSNEMNNYYLRYTNCCI